MDFVSYVVFASPKQGVLDNVFVDAIKAFLDYQIEASPLHSYQIIPFTDKANFQSISDFQIICHYLSQEDLKTGFKAMDGKVFQEPHKSLTDLTESFRVSFANVISY